LSNVEFLGVISKFSFKFYRPSCFPDCHSARLWVFSHFLKANRVRVFPSRAFWTGTERVLCVILQTITFLVKAQSETLSFFALSELVNREAVDFCGFLSFFLIFCVIDVFLDLFRGPWNPLDSVCNPVSVFWLDFWRRFLLALLKIFFLLCGFLLLQITFAKFCSSLFQLIYSKKYKNISVCYFFNILSNQVRLHTFFSNCLQVGKIKQEKFIFSLIKALGNDFICLYFQFYWRVVWKLNVIS